MSLICITYLTTKSGDTSIRVNYCTGLRASRVGSKVWKYSPFPLLVSDIMSLGRNTTFELDAWVVGW